MEIKFETMPANPHLNSDNAYIGHFNKIPYDVATKFYKNELAQTDNLLFLYGGAGCGKTYLLHVLLNNINKRLKGNSVCFISSEMFIRNFHNAVVNNEKDEYRRSLNQYDLLILDNFQELYNKEQSQKFLAELIDSFLNENKIVVIASSITPSKLNGFNDKLLTIIKSGVSVCFEPISVQEAKLFIRYLANQRNLELSNEILKDIDIYSNPSIRKLTGIVKTLGAYDIKSIEESEKILKKYIEEIYKEQAPYQDD